ncbi:D,D-heptose 1,7-bisphosphate phosphatase [Nostoc sp. DSM 114161]|jgi:D-glycero-D-manno-heptose 1,7-bisphosphate phosphatase|uniref:hypothetical protein n=1 Tax=Nostoc sp. DSM 114161 TaxID=3440143 RepID=UPI00404626E2
MVKILFLDIDGTATETISGHTFKQHPQDVKVMEGADKAVSHYHNQGWTVIGVSNQGGCSAIDPATGKPRKSIEDAIAEMQFTLELFPKLELILFCPDFDGERLISVGRGIWSESRQLEGVTDSYRKPGIGMIQYVRNGYCEISDKIEDCYFVGDRPQDDEQCAINARIDFCPANVWRDRFRPGMFTHQVTPKQLKFLEGVEFAPRE